MNIISGKGVFLKLKKILSSSLILVMLLSLCTPLITISEAKDDNSEYCNFDVNWSNETKELSTNSNTSVSATFKLDLNTIQTGFKSLQMYVSDISENKVKLHTNVTITDPNDANVDRISGNRLIFKDTVNAGTSLTSTISFVFPRTEDFSDYDKSISVTLTGEYLDPETNEYVQINIERILNVSVKPTNEVFNYYTSMELKKEYANGTNQEYIYGPSIEGKIKYLGWKAHNVVSTYTISLASMTYTQSATLDITINRTSTRNDNPMNSEYTINFGGLEKIFGEPQEIKNDNGSVTYRFIKGEDSEEFSFDKCFSLASKEYTVTVNYTIPDTENSPTPDSVTDSVTTKTYFNAKINGTGWDVVRGSEGLTTNKRSYSRSVQSTKDAQVLYYLTGYHSWADINYETSENSKSLTEEKLEALANGESIDLGFRLAIRYTIDRDTDEQTGSIIHNGLTISYLGDNKQVKTISVGESMLLKSVAGSEGMTLIENGQNHELSDSYTVEDGSKISSYSVNLNNFLIKQYSGYNVIYTLSGAKLKELGLSETEIKNITSIGQNAKASGNEWLKGEKSAYYYNVDAEANKKSYMELDIGDSNGNTNTYGKKEDNTIYLRIFKNEKVIKDSNVTVKVVNPTIYVKFPDAYKHVVKEIALSNNVNGKMYVDTYRMENGYLIIECKGTYESPHSGQVMEIAVKTERELLDANIYMDQRVQAWLFTDNENYVNKSEWNINPNKSSAEYKYKDFGVERSSGVYIRTGIYKNNVMNIPDGDSVSSKSNPIRYKNNEIVTYRTKVNANGETLKNISIINRLPLQGNKSINGNVDLGSNISLTDLQNIKVYFNNNIVNTAYTVLYSQDGEANADSDFAELTDSTDLNTVKTIKIVMRDDFTVYGNSELIVEYQMTMPNLEENENNLAGAISSISYTDSKNVSGNLESSAAYVTNGNDNGQITLKKVFEGIEEGVPEGISLKGIKFRFINVDTNEVLVKEGQTEVGIFETDENGIINIQDVPEGTYRVVEESEFDNYKGIDYTEVTIKNGKAYPETIEAKNKLKLGTLKVHKLWADANENQGDVTLKVERTDDLEFSATAVADKETGIAVFEGLPYGEYKITETWGVYGWHGKEVIVNVNDEIVEKDYENYITKGTLQIVKTVPEKETVEGLTFRISGEGDISYINKDGEEVRNTINKEIVIGGDNGDITTDISEDKKQVTITVPNLPVGSYKIEEINMPEINTETGVVTKYVNLSKTINIPDEEGKITNITLKNKYKTGNLNINVTATEGTDLEQFKVKITGISYYGTRVAEEINVPSNGKITLSGLEIGKYKIEEADTKEVNGKILTTSPDGYEVSYNPEDANTNGIEIEYGKTSDVNIHNEYAGKGIVKIIKTLEEEEDISKASGIQFKIKGKDLVGKDVDETITIGENGIGTSNEIPVGTYLLSEIEETVPDIYAVCEEQEITIKTENTSENPLELNIENKLAIGKIIMETELATGGYPSEPVTYSVTKVNDKLQALDKSIEVTGDRKSHAELNDVKAGKYLVEQKIIPEGYIKDTRQVVNITRNESGYALFIIDKEQIEELEKTKVTINKQILNENGETATDKDFEDAKIDTKDKYSFEVKIQNVNTKETYYSFIDDKNSDTIVGLPYGTYEIEEVYKPKYKMLEMQGERLIKNEETGKMTFTLSEDNEEIQNNIIINVKNQIDKEFGFGGQDSKDNLSKVLVEGIEDVFVTKAKIYIRDDENNKVSDATFKLYDSNGNIVKLAGSDGIYFESDEGNEVISPVNGSIILRALPVGEYKLVNESVNESFLKSSNRTVTVYESAVGVTRIELLRNIPRGSIRLSTVYTDESGTEHYAPSSKYKILNPETSEVLTFIKKADGTYERSNLPNATEKISLKAGYVDVNGIEAGTTYQVGIVDVTGKYGIIKEVPEDVSIEDGESKEIKVSVKDRSGGFVKVITPTSGSEIVALDKEGKIWIYYGWGASPYELQYMHDISRYSSIKDIKFYDVSAAGNHIIAIDTDGKLWNLTDGTEPVCISDIEGNPLCDNNVKIKKVVQTKTDGRAVFVLDEQGKVWFWGDSYGMIQYADPNPWLQKTEIPVCISDTIDELKDLIITDIFAGYNSVIAIDNDGKVWTWGYNEYSQCGLPFDRDNKGPYYIKPTCISDLEGSNIKNVKMKKATSGYGITLLIDTQNRLWAFGSSNYGMIGNGVVIENKSSDSNPYYWNPICLNDNNESNPLNGIGIIDVECQYETVTAVDVNGKLWTWGYDGENGLLGTGDKYTYDGSVNDYNDTKGYAIYPMCITDLENNELNTVKLVSVSATYYNNGAALDNDGNIWLWGENSLPLGHRYLNNPIPPTKLTISKVAHFEIPNFEKIDAGYYSSAGIDENGRVWTWGYSSYYGANLGTGIHKENNYSTAKPVMIGGHNNRICNERIVDVSVGYYHTLAIDDKGKLWFWGYDYDGGSGLSYKKLGEYTGDPVCITNMNYEENIVYGKKIVKIEAGYEMSAIIDSEGKLYTCGSNRNGALGNGTSTKSVVWQCINDLYPELENKKIIDVSISNTYDSRHLIVLDEDGNVWTCGRNENGQLGYSANNTNNPNLRCISDMLLPITKGKKIISVSAGDRHSAALDEDGKVYLWGRNDSGELGNGTTNSTHNAICLTDYNNSELYGKKIEKVEAGYNMTLVVDSEGRIYTCGDDYCGQLGQGNIKADSLEMKCINRLIDFIPKDISVGPNYDVIAIDTKGEMWAWGDCQYNKNGLTENATSPVKLKGLTEKINPNYNKKIESLRNDIPGVNRTIKTTKSNSVAKIELEYNGKLWVSGNNNGCGILGIGTTEPVNEPICINDKFLQGHDIESILYFAQDLIVVKDTDGGIWIWGANSNGECGNGTQSYGQMTPVRHDINISSFTRYGNQIYATTEDGQIYMWGANQNKECGSDEEYVLSPNKIEKTGELISTLGNSILIKDNENNYWRWGKISNDESSSEPICLNQINGFSIDKIINNGVFIIVQDTEGKIWLWGQNSYGQCGNGTTDYVYNPICLNDKFTVDKIIATGYTNIMQDTEGKIWAWGQNGYGKCGTGTTTNVTTPTQINTDTNFKIDKIITTGNTNIVQDTEGRIWSWGQNSYGQCGTGTTTNVTTPTQINTDTNFKIDKIITTGNTNIVQDTEGRIWSWGQNSYGQCGTGTTTNVTTPTQINTGTNFRIDKIIIAGDTNIIQDTEGKIWSWGRNNYGQCGTGTTTNVLTPTQINSETNFRINEIITTGYTNTVQDTEGKIWSWGWNAYGQCGTGNGKNVLVPTCILEGMGSTDIERLNPNGYTIFVKDSNGKVWSWGNNGSGKCGTNITSTFATPKCINSIEGLENIEFNEITGTDSITAVDSNGKTWVWGNNSNGSLLIGNTSSSIRYPVCRDDFFTQIGLDIDSSEIQNVKPVSGVTIIVDKTGNIWTLGNNENYQCGTGDTTKVTKPTCITKNISLRVEEGDRYYQNANITYVLKQNGEVWAWGNIIKTPTKINDLDNIKGSKIKDIVDTQDNNIYALTEDGTIYQIFMNSNELVALDMTKDETYVCYEGPWKNEFMLVKDASYTK